MFRSLISLLALAAMLNHAVFAAVTDGSPLHPPTDATDGLGTVQEYVSSSPDDGFMESYIAPLGIDVTNGAAQLSDGRAIRGARVCSVRPDTAGAAAGLRDPQTVASALLTAGLIIGTVFFPPAMLGIAIVQGAGIGKSFDLTVAVDGQRIHNVSDLHDALNEATAGQMVYLVVIRKGQRESIVIRLTTDYVGTSQKH
jgi:S1-C subfamily serine protease